jgi:MFS family permease
MENAPVVAAPAKPPRPWTLFASGAFRNLWAATALSLVGENFSYIAFAWLVLLLTGSSLALGSVLVAQSVPRAVLMLVGGALVDRISARLTMLASMTLRVACVAPLAVLVFTGHTQLWEIYAISLVFGVVDALYYPAQSTILPRIVADDRLEAGNAILNVTVQGTVILGPTIAGVVVSAFGVGWAFVADAACFAVGALFLLWMPSGSKAAGATTKPEGRMRDEILAGFRYAWADIGIRASLLIIAVVDFAINGALGVGLPTLAHGRFGAGAAGLGLLFGAWGVGATLGAVASGMIKAPKHFGWLVIATCAWLGLPILVVGFVPTLAPAAVVIAIAGVATGVINTYAVSWLQRRTDPEMQGRVMSLVMLASVGLTPIGFAASGAIADASVTALFVFAGGLTLLAAAGAAASRSVRSL